MSTRLRCIIPLFDRRGARQIVPVRDQRSVATAQAFDWPGVMLEAGRNDVVEVDEVTFGHHYLGVNVDERPVTMEVKDQGAFRSVTLDPGVGWFRPAGHGFSLRVRCAGPHAYVRVALDPIRFERLVGTSEEGGTALELVPSYGVGGRQLEHLLAALVAEASDGSPSGLAFVDSLTGALSMQLAQQAGVSQPRRPLARGGLSGSVRRRVLELMDAHADRQLSIDQLAREAGLSPAHFARAFKQSVGRAPHQHLMSLRLERARRLLEAPDVGLSDVAQRVGFADQAHFTRFFKRQFGLTPGAFVRARRRSLPTSIGNGR